MIRASVIAAIFLIPFATAAVVDSEPPVFTFCPADILIDNATDSVMRINWQQPIASDNSGVPPSLYSNRQPGEPFSVPGSYQIVYKAVDGSGNEATCSFLMTVQKKSCTLYSAPQNGALACMKYGSDPICAVMCNSESDFVFNPPLLYYCSSGKWQFYYLPGMPYEPTLPWPDCTAQASPSWIKLVNWPYYFFSGDVNDPKIIDTIKNNFISLLYQPYVPPIFCQTDPARCNKDNVDVKV